MSTSTSLSPNRPPSTPSEPRRPRFLEGVKPHELYDPPIPPPTYGESRASYIARTGLDTPDDGRLFRGWVKNRSRNYREQWLNPESWEIANARKKEAHRKYDSRNKQPKNRERNARRDGTYEEKRGTPELHRLAISKHGMTTDEFNELSPEQQALLRQLDLIGADK